MHIHRLKRSAVATGLVAGLVAGGAAGAVLGGPGLSGAQEDRPTSTTVAPESGQDAQGDPAAGDERGHQWRDRADERLGEALAPLVEDGTIDQAQADAVVEQLLESKVLRHGGPPGGGPPHVFGFGPGMDAAAEALGMSEEELRDALRDGSTLAEVAEAKGVPVGAVVDALVAKLSNQLDERVADGDLTREDADERLADATERITEMVQEGGPMIGRHHHGVGDHGPAPDEPADPED